MKDCRSLNESAVCGSYTLLNEIFRWAPPSDTLSSLAHAKRSSATGLGSRLAIFLLQSGHWQRNSVHHRNTVQHSASKSRFATRTPSELSNHHPPPRISGDEGSSLQKSQVGLNLPTAKLRCSCRRAGRQGQRLRHTPEKAYSITTPARQARQNETKGPSQYGATSSPAAAHPILELKWSGRQGLHFSLQQLQPGNEPPCMVHPSGRSHSRVHPCLTEFMPAFGQNGTVAGCSGIPASDIVLPTSESKS